MGAMTRLQKTLWQQNWTNIAWSTERPKPTKSHIEYFELNPSQPWEIAKRYFAVG